MRDAGGHSGHARSTESCCGVSSLARAGRGGAGGSGAMNGCGFLATGSGMPLIVQPQSEHDVSAGTSARMNSWPFCLHARCPRAGHTQTLAHASQCVAAERVSTGICVHHARVSWISKQPGIICPSRSKATCAHSCTFCIRPTLCSRSRSVVRAGACVWSTVEHAQATSEKAAKADVYRMLARSQWKPRLIEWPWRRARFRACSCLPGVARPRLRLG